MCSLSVISASWIFLTDYSQERVSKPGNIARVRGELVQCREMSKHREAHLEWLENLLNLLATDFSKYIFDLRLPVAEKADYLNPNRLAIIASTKRFGNNFGMNQLLSAFGTTA
jgi:hypothetical protein